MKLHPLAFGIAALGIVSCVDAPKTSSTEGLSYEEYRALVQEEPGTGGYILDWDVVVFSEEAIYNSWKQTQQGALSIYNIGGQDVKWTAADVKNLTFCVGAGFGAQKQLVINAMTGATVGGWEKYGDVKFVYDATQDANCNANNQNVKFDVNLAPTGVQYLARAFFPNSPRTERNVLIAAEAFDPNQTGGIPLTNILIHELGHTLGFRHEHIARPGQNIQGCVEDNQYRVIGTYDVTSTMHYPQCGSPGNTLALSAQDQSGVAAIYGAARVNVAPMAQLTSPAEGASVGPNFNVEANVMDDDLVSVELFVDDALIETKATGPFTFMLTAQAQGLHNIDVVATDAGGLTTTQSVSVNVRAAGTGGGNGDGDGDDGDGTGGDESQTDVTGGCSTGGNGAGAGMLLLGLVGLLRRRKH